jgi:hypothetical protein
MNGLIENLTGEGLQNLSFLIRIFLNASGSISIQSTPMSYDIFYEAPGMAANLDSVSVMLGGLSANLAQMLQ